MAQERIKMECPHCQYKHGWCNESLKVIEGDKGKFFELPIEMERPTGYLRGSSERKYVYGCPSCSKIFMEL